MITLELSDEQAKTLRFIVDMIGGSRGNSRRKHTDQIAAQLQERGIYPEFSVEKEFNRPASGYLYFLEDVNSKHDWVEVTPHQHAGSDERHFICAHCTEFKIEKVA